VRQCPKDLRRAHKRRDRKESFEKFIARMKGVREADVEIDPATGVVTIPSAVPGERRKMTGEEIEALAYAIDPPEPVA
jgi:hypothetical protein